MRRLLVSIPDFTYTFATALFSLFPDQANLLLLLSEAG